MADNEQKAMQLMADAEKKLNTQKGFFGALFGCVFSSLFVICQTNSNGKNRLDVHNNVQFVHFYLHENCTIRFEFCEFSSSCLPF